MIRKYQVGNDFEPNQFSFNTKLKGLSRIQPKLPSTINTKPQANLTPINTQPNEATPVNIATGLNTSQQIATGASTNTGQREAMGANVGTGSTDGSNFNLKSFDDYSKGVKGSGIRPLEALQLATPLALSFLNKPKGATFKRQSNVINPATGLPYETINQVEQNVNRGLRGLSRNKSTDILTNMINMNMGQANANQQLNDLYTKNAEQYFGDKRRMVSEINQEQKEADEFYNRNEALRAEADANNKANQNRMIGDVVKGIGDIDAMNRQEKEMKKAQLFDLYAKENQLKFQDQFGNYVQTGLNKANERTKAMSGIQEAQMNLDKLKQSGVKEDSPEYIEAKKKYDLAESVYKKADSEYNTAVSNRNKLDSDFNKRMLAQSKRQIMGYKKGGLTLEERKDLKQQEYELKKQLQDAKEKSIEARERYKELKKQELEFRKEMRQDMRDSKKTINDFYKACKK